MLAGAAAVGLCVGVVVLNLGDHGEAHPAALQADALLPDLDQETPSGLDVRREPGGGYVLGFTSRIRNIGDGPLVIEGARASGAATTRMPQVDQVVDLPDGSAERVPDVGELTYVTSTDHQHWHLSHFDRYELRRAGSDKAVVEDQKTGFCLGDRYVVESRAVPHVATHPVYTDNCGEQNPDLTHLVEGISVGYGDVYAAHLEYQDLPLNGLPDGRYVLVHEANADRSLREVTYANNAASLLLDLRWDEGTPTVRIVDSCPDTDRCDQQVRVRTIATGLQVPWDIAFLPDGGALVTERPGRVRLLTGQGRLQREPVARIAVTQAGEGGLLGIALDPDFADNHQVYLYFSRGRAMHLERWRWTGTRLVREVDLVRRIRAGDIHDSGRIRFGPDGLLYLTTGDAGDPSLAQDPDSRNGKLLTLTPEQFRGPGATAPTVLASGLRNSQAFDWQPGTGLMVANDHGPSGFDGPEGYDEVDVIVPGSNYGWPEVIGFDTGGGRFAAPARLYREPIAPSGGSFLTGRSAWRGQYVLAALRGEELRRLLIEDGRVVSDEPFLTGTYGRLRNVVGAPDGSLYVLTSNTDGRGTPRLGDDRILQLRLPRQ